MTAWHIGRLTALTALILPGLGAQASPAEDGRQLNLLYWQAPTVLNPYLSVATKDADAAALVLEPLASINPEGEPVPRLATELPSRANGGFSEDGTQVTWRLRDDVLWSDGEVFDADDVRFTIEYCQKMDPVCAQESRLKAIEKVEIPDPLTVILHYKQPQADPFGALTGAQSPILQEAQFSTCLAGASADCDAASRAPIGTGPFKVTHFTPGDRIDYAANPHYRTPGQPYFNKVMLKGGGEVRDAARAVLETGEFDFAWNLQIAPETLALMADGGQGEVMTGFGTLVERIALNLTDPSPELPEDERSTRQHPHPILSDQRVRAALSMAIDREMLASVTYGDAGLPICDLIPAPAQFATGDKDCLKQDIATAGELLNKAGWIMDETTGIRRKNDEELRLVLQTTASPLRQDVQALIRQWWQEIGVDTELRSINASVFFGANPHSDDTLEKFYADAQIYADNFSGRNPFPMLASWRCDHIPAPENDWQGDNISRFCDRGYDHQLDQLIAAPTEAERIAEVQALNQRLSREDIASIPLIHRGNISAKGGDIRGVGALNAWDSELWNIAEWSREAGED